MQLEIKDIRREPDVQLRDGLDMDRVNAMVEFTTDGGTLPPVTVVGDDNLLADGHHRVYAAERSGKDTVEANRERGGMAEAIAIALNRNDTAQAMPLNRIQRNAGIKRLLDAGWSMRRIAKETGISFRTVGNIAQTREVRATLPPAVNAALKDTTVTRIATLPKKQQVPFATAVATTPGGPLAEPRVREAIKAVKAGATTHAAVAAVTPTGIAAPTPMSDVAKQVRRRLKNFLDETMTVDGRDYDFWQVLDVLAAHLRTTSFAGDLHAAGLADLLSEVAVKADASASALRSQTLAATNGAKP